MGEGNWRFRLVSSWAAALTYMGAVLWMGSQSDPVPGLRLAGGLDKVAHAGAYGLLAFLFATALVQSWPGRSRPGLTALAVLMATLCGVVDEIHQSFVPGRHGDVGDVIADATGATLGAFLFLGLSRILARRRGAGMSK